MRMFFLPAIAIKSTSRGLSRCDRRTKTGRTTATVLIVDDELIIVDVFGRLLSNHGYDVLIAHGARQALEIIRDVPGIDVVLSDITMPEMRGTDLIREIAEKYPQIACVLMTGGTVDSAVVPPRVPLFRKPLSKRDLIALVEEAIARSSELKAKVETGEPLRRITARV
jgi:DNA-binding NtrC family response regulator